MSEYDVGVHDVKDMQVEVEHDRDAFDPRADYDHVGTMVCWHRQYNLGDEQPEGATMEYYREHIEPHEESGVVLPLYLYDHSGITISTTDFNDPWDSGMVGWIYCTKEDVEREWNGDLDLAKKYLEGEVAEYDQYLRGDIYCVIVYSLHECSLGYIHREIEDSLCGLCGLEAVAEYINSYFDLEDEVA